MCPVAAGQQLLLNPQGGDAFSAGTAIDVASVAGYAAGSVSPLVISPTDITTGASVLLPTLSAPTVPSVTSAPAPTMAASALNLSTGRRLAISLPLSLAFEFTERPLAPLREKP